MSSQKPAGAARFFPSSELMPVVRAALERGQSVRLTVNGESMAPFIHDGNVVDLEPIGSRVVVGDVVLVTYPKDKFVLHRVVRIKDNGLFLRGDAHVHLQGPFPQHAVLGKVIVSYHNGGARVHTHGAWRFAGLVWIRSCPLSPWLIWLVSRICNRKK